MSPNTPSGPSEGPYDAASGSGEGRPEYLGDAPDAPAAPSGPAKRWPVLGAVAVGVAAAVGLGGWGAFALLSGGGAQPAEALPADAVAYASLDLDPSASQKIEAFKILKKFPGLQKELGLDTTDDLRRLVFKEIQDEGDCKKLDYDSDIEPWIGERIAVAAVPSGGKADSGAPVVALQVTDPDAAEKGIQTLADCGEAEADFGYAFSDDYVLVTDSQKRADALVADAAESSLADDDSFQEWTGKVGDPGILTMYAAPGAPEYFQRMQEDMGQGIAGSDAMYGLSMEPAAARTGDQMEDLAKNFKGMAGTVRFDDGAVEAEFAADGLPAGMSSDGETSGPRLADLPASTGAALSVGLPEGWLDKSMESMAGVLGSGESMDEMWAEGERETGLTLPEDIETVLGDGVSLSFDADTDLEALFESDDPSALPIGLRIAGDSDEIVPIIEKIKTAIGPDADMLVVEASDGGVAVGLNSDYVNALVEGGGLGDEDSFQRVIPDPDKATAAAYVNFDAGDGWAEQLADSLGDGDSAEARENVAPLDALGMSSWVDGDVQRGLFRLTTD